MSDALLNAIAAAAPVAFTVLAVVTANLFPDNRAAKIFHAVAVVIVGVVAVWASTFALGLKDQKTAEAASKIEAVREGLGQAISEGNALVADCYDESFPLQVATQAAWERKTADFLRLKLGASYVSRFYDFSDLVIRKASLPMKVTPPERLDAASNINDHIIRLEEFSRELIVK